MNQFQNDARSTARGAIIGAATAVVVFGGVSVALAATQAGINQSQTPISRPAVQVTQTGVKAAQEVPRAAPAKPAQKARPVSQPVRATPAKQAGLTEAASPSREVKKAEGERDGDRRDLASAERSAPAPQNEATSQQSPVQAQAPVAPVRQAPSYPVQQAPAAPVQQVPSYPVQQAPAPAPAPAPVQQAPAPAPAPEPGITIDLGGRGAVVPQAPIAPKQLHLG